MWYLLLEPLVFNRWQGELGGGLSDTLYFSYFKFRGEWIMSYEGVSLNFSVPFVFPLGQRFSLSDMEMGLGFVFADRNRLDFNLVLPTGILSSKYPGVSLRYRRIVKLDSSYALYGSLLWYFMASSDRAEKSLYNKVIDRHGYRHLSLDLTYIRRVGETAFWKVSLPLDYAYSSNLFWGGIRLGFGLFPFVELDATFWPTKPRPHLFLLRVSALVPTSETL